MMEPGTWVRLHRKKMGWTMTKLQKETGLNWYSMQAVEKGVRAPSIKFLAKVCDAWKLTLWEAFFLMEKADPEDYRPEEV